MTDFDRPLRLRLNVRWERADATTGYTWGKPARESNILAGAAGDRSVQDLMATLGVNDDDIIAERWICSDDPDGSRLEPSGPPLGELLREAPRALLGDSHVASLGPYLHVVMKLLDTHRTLNRGGLSVQLHPPEGYAPPPPERARPPKPEMWLGTGRVYLGWKRQADRGALIKQCAQLDGTGRIEEMLNSIEITPDLPILVPGGAVHAIRADSFLAEWSTAPAGTSIEDATIALYDGTDGKRPRPGKADLSAALVVLDHCDAYEPDTRFRSLAVPIDADHAGNRRRFVFRQTHVCVEEWTVCTTLRAPPGRGLPLYVDDGVIDIACGAATVRVRAGEECFLPASVRDFTLHNVGTDSARVYVWYRSLETPSAAISDAHVEDGCMTIFTNEDRNQFERRGSQLDDVLGQLEIFRRGPRFAVLARPCTVDDGIVRLSTAQESAYANAFSSDGAATVVKFVPASGAATRMFRELSADAAALALDATSTPDPLTVEFIEHLAEFAFYDELVALLEERGHRLSQLVQSATWLPILDALLGEDGLSYGALPKGLIRFHREETGNRAPFEEHLVEALAYAKGADQVARVHFTVSAHHMGAVKAYIESVRPKYEVDGVRFEISYSEQDTGTDTVGVDEDNEPIREADGALHFRPAGHGALIHNMAALDGDIAFVKNIDNVVPDSFKPEANRYKPVLGGLLLTLRQRIFGYLNQLHSGGVSQEELDDMLGFVESELHAQPPMAVLKGDRETRIAYLIERFDRPIRVCGMVPNAGEPGGGPFWLEGEEFALQIIESAQVDLNNPEQASRWGASSHFNPVDLVCSLTDRHGEHYDLAGFVDPDSGFISHKSLNGQALKALELPGLWNGAMAYWNTVFVEVPAESFNPVKTVVDLLRKSHTD
ncbi:MAG: DUF4301 family protein [Gammaproteobacteria bacterium]|nr:DUF4301 family protein [Gammaproteobacteria bacterium]